MDKDTIKIANCSGYYGDKLSAAKEMADGALPSKKLGLLKAFWLNSRDEKKVLKSLDI
ncbi:DUF1446 domain-containing protein [Gammaproteobacteria bacterium]|nr:DUF1446 domain-containing protein [Gammaproteobacteria bacterium]